MTRRQEREQVFQLLFETEFHSEIEPSAVYTNACKKRSLEETQYIHDTFFGTAENCVEEDKLISAFAHKWKVSRMSAVTRSILRLGVYEMLWGQIPPKAAINEAVELAKIYDDASTPAFINGILNQIARNNGLLQDEPKVQPSASGVNP